ncbi:CDP-diacylglycerol diphosphatase [Granulicella sp. dw_53]|uniref:CDP-diacylglycerol diphosphatase n=1 Tax=Granulicella sp. dw_53 TaxID=2719792 RepID=UPI001BD291D1|nr:CDP-diacylglycerol diphosphatase [Granulicella sp. dw_53]
MKKWIVVLVVIAVAAGGFGLYQALKTDPNALWAIVHDGCVKEEQAHGKPTPCSAVDLKDGWAVFKDKRGKTQVLLIPTTRVTGIEDPQILRPNAPNYWQAAWDANLYVQQRAPRMLRRDELALAINSKDARSQDQLHIHVDCVRVDVHNQLHAEQVHLSEAWSDLTVNGAAYRARTLSRDELHDDNVFELVEKQLPPGEGMDQETVVITGANLPLGKEGFDVLVGRGGVGGNSGGGESLQDHACEIARE